MAKKIYDESGVDYSNVIISKDHATGAAGILIDEKSEQIQLMLFQVQLEL